MAKLLKDLEKEIGRKVGGKDYLVVTRCKECPLAVMGRPWTCKKTGNEVPIGLVGIAKDCPLDDWEGESTWH